MANTLADTDDRQGLGDARPGLLILALAVFAGVTTEVLPVGLLPTISRTFAVSESTTGLLVSLYAGLVAVLAVPLTLVTRRIPRKRLLLIATGIFAVSNALSAIASSLAVLAVARALGGATHAVFFSLCIGYAARLVPPAKTGKALALASTGISAGFVLGVPLATALGNAVGWRGSFAALAALMTLTLVLIAITLPAVDAPVTRQAGAPGGRRRLLAAVSSNALLYTGHNTLYTYVSVLLLRAGATPDAIGLILLLFGGLGLVGVSLAGPQLDRRFRHTALAVLVVLGFGILGTGAAFPSLVLVIAAGAVWNGAFGPTASIYQTAAVRTEATTAELAGAWIVATSNVGIAAGAALGGVVLESAGIRAVAWAAASTVALAAVVVVVARGAFPTRSAH
ncbi:MFS transporter [Cryptosporangium aurantiacum]|uniref:Predicted arabinose efflux permease, MFS family n=1 Tax=Cryptosporangium aurantiacum TaxID=134849 RepID=A0A1M7RG25_9ACTN|nr:MFS transporter [Cryptosporangium aurantiacum]SHN45245.1 Predicted arabinose efflux permease, MFS family [Cryptosporangium aurantiacum]